MSWDTKRPRNHRLRTGRRDFLRILGGAAASGWFSPLASAFNSPPYPFAEVLASRSGLTFVHTAGSSPEKYLPESTGAGCAFFDYDNDGWMDIYLVNSGKCDFFTPKTPLRNALYHNNRDGTFTDITEKAGVTGGGYGMGVAVGDYNADGFPDLYLTQYGRSILYRNNGDGTFTDVSQKTGIADNPGKSWGVVATDVNNDGWMDLFVANDTVANFLFMNRAGKRFEEIGFTAGVAYGEQGRARSGMGVDSADFNEDGWMDLFVTNMDHELYGIYQNKKDETFDDVAAPTGIARATQLMSGWGLKFFDYDNDGNLDLFVANGHPDDLIEKIYPTVFYREPPLLFHNSGSGLVNVSAESGPIFARPMASRGLALGDFDNDGAVDVLISNNDEPPLLLRNLVGSQNHWLGINLIGKNANPDAIGARVTYQASDLKRSRMKVGGGSYLSSHDPRIVLGIGQRKKFDWVEVKWPQPSGRVERFTDLPIDRYVTIVEGEGKWK